VKIISVWLMFGQGVGLLCGEGGVCVCVYGVWLVVVPNIGGSCAPPVPPGPS
jgi:hypothetical protein